VVPLRAGLPRRLQERSGPLTHGRPERPAPGVRAGGWWAGGFVVDSPRVQRHLLEAAFATILVVALVLITYRSPCSGWCASGHRIADQAASAIVYLLASHAGLVVNGESAGILRVLVFGAGTD